MIWNESKECMDIESLSYLQSERLKKLVKRIYHNVPSYRTKMQELDLIPSDIESIDDIVKLPFTTKEDLRNNYPYGLFAKPISEIVRVHASSGTSGKATIVGYTPRDIEIWMECVTRVLAMAGIGKNDTMQVSYGYGLFTGGLGLHYGAENLGCTVIPMSTTSTKKQIEMMEDLNCTAIACTPSYLMHLAEAIEESDRRPNLKLKVAICGAEPWTDNMRIKIENQLGIKAYDIYGLSEIIGPGVAADCEYHEGLHIYEDHFYPEILDPETLKPVADGEVGELVITTLTKEGFPLIRYRTKDLTSINHEKCKCGRTHARISKFIGRSDDMLVIRGVNVFPSQIEAALLELGETSYYQIIVDRVDNMDTFDLLVEVDDSFFSDEVRQLEKKRQDITKGLRDYLGLNVKVKLVEPRTIERTAGKAKRVIDKRIYD